MVARAGRRARSWAARARSPTAPSLYLRIAALGAPFFMLATAGQGFLRGIGRPAHAAADPVAAHAVNVVLELLFVYGFDWGLAGSAWGTVIAQARDGPRVRAVQRRAGWERPLLGAIRPLLRIGGEIAVRTTALLGPSSSPARCSPASAPPSLGAHQIAFQLFVFLALVLDALAIAGAGDGRADARRGRRRRAPARRRADDRLVGRFGAASASCCWRSATSSRGVHRRPRRDRAGARGVAAVRAMMPANGAVFALDGILIGAGDTRFLMWGMVAAAAVYVPFALLALAGMGDRRRLVRPARR